MGYFDNNASTRKHRSTKNKIPPRYILTPIPPSRQTQNPINKNIDPYSRNRITQNGGQSKQFGTCRRRSYSTAKSLNKKCSLFETNITSNSKIFDVDDERPVEINK
ncbi:unnamed protein product [Rotaria socialis]|uniref:Uncharacterized protein n=1 Tax=Rotaria socialis TaxID=392032 RepID=A0A818CW54_9BILA|nr:unnamed protein product [Rotaria socialis]CAF4783680.1 unnamed protein product [Rotaria socialis]